MKKIIILTVVFNYLFFFQNSILAGELKVTVGNSNKVPNYKKAYFAGGCFWCMEETFDQFDGIVETTLLEALTRFVTVIRRPKIKIDHAKLP